jgi:hypothetical protein
MTSAKLIPLLLALGPGALAAQQGPDSRWLPWLGCWQVGEFAASGSSVVCVRPASEPLGVEVATVSAGEIAFSRILVADERPHDLAVEDCAGTETARFSADGRRVYLRSRLTCAGGQHRTASAIMGMASPAVWLDAQSLGMNDERVPRVLHYYPAPVERWPDGFRLSTERAAAVTEARALAASRLSLLDVREAAEQADPEAASGYLLGLSQRFDLTADGLAALDDAGVPGEVIDAVVAASYPERFAVDRTEIAPAIPGEEEYVPGRGTPYDPYGWGWYGYGRGGCYDWMYCYPYGYDLGYRASWYGGYWGQVFITPRSQLLAPSGTAVGGRGYTRGGQPTGTGEGRYAKRRGETTAGGTGTAGWSSAGSGSTGTGSVSPGGYSRGGGGSSSSGSSSGGAKPKGRSQ